MKKLLVLVVLSIFIFSLVAISVAAGVEPSPFRKITVKGPKDCIKACGKEPRAKDTEGQIAYQNCVLSCNPKILSMEGSIDSFFDVFTELRLADQENAEAIIQVKEAFEYEKGKVGVRFNEVELGINVTKNELKEGDDNLQVQLDSYYDMLGQIQGNYNVDSFFDVFTELDRRDDENADGLIVLTDGRIFNLTEINWSIGKLGEEINITGTDLFEADEDLQNQITEINKSLYDLFLENVVIIGAVSSLGEDLNETFETVGKAVQNETDERIFADLVLQNQLTALGAALQDTFDNLGSAFQNETNERLAGDQYMQQQINSFFDIIVDLNQTDQQIETELLALSLQGDQNEFNIDSFFDVFTQIEVLYNVDSFFDVFVELDVQRQNMQTQIDSFFDVFTEIEVELDELRNATEDCCWCECPSILAPVCGQDGNTYVNPCLMECEGVAKAYGGECSEVYCGGYSQHDPEVCSGNGVCENDGTCNCNELYTGTFCETYLGCSVGDTRPCYTGPPLTRGIGECADGTEICGELGIWGNCIGESLPLPDICDGLDNDCDPTTPDGSGEANYGQACDGPDADDCADGFFACGGAGMYCDEAAGSVGETCNGLDDDCDGQVDEDWPDLGQACGEGACAGGTIICRGPTTTGCSTNDQASVEVCNGVDDDCDGDVDEDNVCGCNPSPEICDGIDNDCDGDIDEGTDSYCDDGIVCTNDYCIAGQCENNPDNAVCEDGNQCTESICDRTIGCINPPLSPRIPCEDGDACTENDVCDGTGICQGAPLTCETANPCMVGVCDSQTGCSFVPNVGISCGTTDPCFVDGVCTDQGICALDFYPCPQGEVCLDVGGQPTCVPQ